MKVLLTTLLGLVLFPVLMVQAEDLPKLTSLSQPRMRYQVAKTNYVVLQRGGIRAVVVNNSAVKDNVLPNHWANYPGLAYLGHTKQPRNLFIPDFGGMTPVMYMDGANRTKQVLKELKFIPDQLRIINAHTVELYQPASPTWGVENIRRFELLADGTIEVTFEFIPHLPQP